MKRILAAIGNVLGFALGIVSIPIGLFMGLLFMALPIVFVLWVLGVWPVDDNTNESIVQPTPLGVTTDCDRLATLIDEGKSGQACLETIGGEAAFDEGLAYFRNLVITYDLPAEDAVTLFDDWLATQSPDCQIWVAMMQAFDNCP